MNKTSKKVFNMALATTMAAGAIVAVAPTADAAKSFPDVKDPNSAHYNNIYNLVERGIIKGYEDGTFRPGESIKRGHAAKIIAGVLGLDTKNVKNPGFKDISTKNPYYGAIASLANAGIIGGFEDNTYRHNDTLTRGQMAKIIAKAFELKAGKTENPFTDVKDSQYVDYITALFANGVTTGKTPTTFDAKSPVTRAQLASFVVRAEKVSEQQTVTTIVVEIKDGKLVTTGDTFTINSEVTKVFNADNAAALKGAEVELVVEDSTVVGVKSITLKANNTTFNANGYEIPKLTINGVNTTIQNAKVKSLVVAQGKKVTLSNVQVGELDIQRGGNIVLDATSTIEKIIIPKNKTIQSIVSKYNEVKNQIKEIVVSDTLAPSTGGGGGGGGKPQTPVVEPIVDSVIDKLFEDYSSAIAEYGTVKFNDDTNEVEITFTSSSDTVAISEVRKAVKENAKGKTVDQLIKEAGLTKEDAAKLLDSAKSIELKAGKYSEEIDLADYITVLPNGSYDADRNELVKIGDLFIDEAIEASGETVKTIAQFKKVFKDNITITIDGIEYTVKVN